MPIYRSECFTYVVLKKKKKRSKEKEKKERSPHCECDAGTVSGISKLRSD